ncbi:AAA family ATPase [Microbulbifer sp. SSSA005]|uniref:AAA family ATPase n=1 Tax=Microbulbifer sp. SSSA005 TaxID=3243378 RepID=UPI004038FC2F
MDTETTSARKLSSAVATLFGAAGITFLDSKAQWEADYKDLLSRIQEARETGTISDKLLEDLWWTRSNGVATIKTGALSRKALEQLQQEFRSLTWQIFSDGSEATHRQVVDSFIAFKSQGLVIGVLHSVINRVFAAAHPNQCTTVVSPNIFRLLLNEIHRRWNIDLPDGKEHWLASNKALKKIINQYKPEIFDDVQTNILIWRLYAENDSQENELMDEKLPLANLPIQPLNQILFGPPGTGKTYNTTRLAVQIADPQWYANQDKPDNRAVRERYDALQAEKRIVFTTFHQSFAYEDFIEGIRAESSDNGQLNYSVQDGVFKELCESADAKVTRQSGEQIDLNGRRFWKMSLGNTLEDNDDIYQECLENNYVLLGYGESIDFSRCTSRDSVRKQFETANSLEIQQSDYPITAVHNFRNTLQAGDLVVISDGNRKFRAIAEITGDYQRLETDERTGYQQARPVKWHRQYEPSLPREQLFKKALSQMTLYELRPSTIDIDKLAELLAPQDISEPQQKPLVLIIDEINRGNISRIFGELITLLEPAKRKGAEDAREVILPYSKKTFSVPPNVYVIGTMNTADKSLAQLDLALRRRFSFVEMPPNPELLAGTQVYGIDIGELLTTLNQRIEALLDRDHLIGHSYFLPLCGLPLEERESKLASIFQQQILPLLQEYFFDDWQRIGWVLNDPAKHPHHRFITEGGQQQLNELFPADIASQINERRFSLNTEAFTQPDAYRGILPPAAATTSPKSQALEEAESEVAE